MGYYYYALRLSIPMENELKWKFFRYRCGKEKRWKHYVSEITFNIMSYLKVCLNSIYFNKFIQIKINQMILLLIILLLILLT